MLDQNLGKWVSICDFNLIINDIIYGGRSERQALVNPFCNIVIYNMLIYYVKRGLKYER
jgi:hypothetical protein